MMVTCPKCSKSLKVKDEWAGKALKCPGCGNTFKADPSGQSKAVAQAGGPRPGAAAVAGKAQAKPHGKVPGEKRGMAINWGPIVMYAGLALIPLGILLFVLGPIRVKRHFDSIHTKAEEDVTDVLDFALKCHASQTGAWNPNKSTGGSPSVNEVRFMPDFLTMSVPDTVAFQGEGTTGKFEGTYRLEDGEIVCDVKIGGLSLGGLHIDEDGVTLPGGRREERPAGAPKFKGAPNDLVKLTGRVKNGTPTAELNGRKAEIYYPPPVDEDGNVIPPDPAKKTTAAAR